MCKNKNKQKGKYFTIDCVKEVGGGKVRVDKVHPLHKSGNHTYLVNSALIISGTCSLKVC